MKKNNLIFYPDKRLRKISLEIKYFKRYKKTIQELSGICIELSAFALAVNQFGIYKRLIVAVTDEKEIIPFFNPKIVEQKGLQIYYETCVSIKNKTGKVKRPYEIKVEYQDINGKKREKIFYGLDTIVMCHEIDHLDGILFIDKTNKIYDKNIKKNHKIISKKCILS